MTCNKSRFGHYEVCDSWKVCWCDATAKDPQTTRVVRTIENLLEHIRQEATYNGQSGFKINDQDDEVIAAAELSKELAASVGVTLDRTRHDELSSYEHNSLILGHATPEDAEKWVPIGVKNGQKYPLYDPESPQYKARQELRKNLSEALNGDEQAVELFEGLALLRAQFR